MRCPHCGSVVEPLRDPAGALFCPACRNTGQVPTPVASPGLAAAAPALRGPDGSPLAAPASPGVTPGKSIAALVLGICGVVLWPLGILLGPLAIGFAVSSRNDSKRDPRIGGKGMAVAGLVLGTVAVVLSVLYIGFMIFLFTSISNLLSDFPTTAATFTFDVDASGPGGVLTVTSAENATFAEWSDYELDGTARCTLPNGPVDVGDRIVCTTDGDVVLTDWSTEEIVYAATV